MASAAVQTTTEVAQAVNYFYDRNMLKAARPLLVHTKWAQVRDIPQKQGDSIRFRRYSLLSANTTALTEGVTPSGKSLTVTNVNATVLWYGDYVTVSDKLVLTTLDPLLTELSDLLGQQAGNSLDQICRDVMAAGTTEQFAGTATDTNEVTSAMKISRDEIRQAVRTLKNNDCRKITSMIGPSSGFNTTPVNACYIGIVHPNTTFDLKNETGFVSVEEYPNQRDVMEGEVGKLDEVRLIESTNAKYTASAGAGGITVYRTLIFGKDFYGISRIAGAALRNIIKPLGSAGSADPLDQRQTSGWKATFVAKILNENYCVGLDHAVSS